MLAREEKKYLGQVTREIDIDTVQHCQVVGQELQRDDRQKTAQTVSDGWDTNQLVGLANVRVTLVADDDGFAFTGSDLLQRVRDFL